MSTRRGQVQGEEREAGVVGKKRVETLVVADKKFIEKHKNDERSITIYILTIMNMVRLLYGFCLTVFHSLNFRCTIFSFNTKSGTNCLFFNLR